MQDRMRRSLLSEREDGFTLVELIVAMIVMAIVFMSIIFIQGRALTTNADSGSRQQATTYANQAMEQMRSMPWNIIKKGLASNYLAAGSAVTGESDPLVAGTTLTVDGVPFPLEIAPAGTADQKIGVPWHPLFDSTGSNTSIQLDPSGRGDEYVVKTYVTKEASDFGEYPRGLVVVVEWDKRTDGQTERTVLSSTAYAPSGGCGDANNAPFLASCQAQFYSGASTANVVISASSSVPGDPANPVSDPNAGDPLPILPGSDFYTMQLSTSGTASRASSQQFTTVDAYARYGGTTRDDSDVDTQPEDEGWTQGYGSFTLRASNDTVSADAPEPNPTDILTSASNSLNTINGGVSSGMSISARSDDSRNGTLDASVTQACSTGVGAATVPATDPCASGRLGASLTPSSNMAINFGGQTLRLGQVSNTAGSTSDSAWAGRFSGAVLGNTVTGCQILADAGCVSAGAVRSVGTINIGQVTSGAGSWTGGAAPQGLAVISGYSDNVAVQRGSRQVGALPTLTRSASVAYWTGSAYTTISAPTNANATGAIPPVTWTTPTAVITATGRVTVSPSTVTTKGIADPLCKAEACEINARHGNITVDIAYSIVPSNPTIAPFQLSVTTTVNGSQAAASYKEPEDNV